jgi:hypothetical protein
MQVISFGGGDVDGIELKSNFFGKFLELKDL